MESIEKISPFAQKRDVVTFWQGVIVGSSEERIFKEVVDDYNRTHPDVYIKSVLIPYNAYIGKINIAIATAQPPDVCWNAFSLLESLKVKKKVPDLAIPIPEEMLTPEVRKYYGQSTLDSVSKLGKVYSFPNCKYLMGGAFLANAKYFEKAGIDPIYYLENGWDYKTFRDDMKKVQAAMQKEVGPDAFAFGINLRNIDSLVYGNFFFPSLGKESVMRNYIYYDEKQKRYVIDPLLTPEKLARPLQLMHDMMYVDGTWSKKFLGLEYSQMLVDLETNNKLAATYAVSMGVSVSEQMTYNKDYERGIHKNPVKMVILPMPTPTMADPIVYTISATGYGVLKQMPYRGKKHTQNALDFAKYLTSPEVLAKFFVASNRRYWPWPNEDAVRKVFGKENDPIITDPWLGRQWNYYLKEFDKKEKIAVTDPNKPIPDQTKAELISTSVFNYLYTGKGHSILENVVYDKIKPDEAAREMLAGVKSVIDSHYK